MVGGTYTAYHNKGGFTRACLLWRHHLRASTPVMLEYSNFNFHLGTRPCLHLTGASTCMGKHAPCTCKPGMSTKCIKSIYVRFTYNKSTQLHKYTMISTVTDTKYIYMAVVCMLILFIKLKLITHDRYQQNIMD